MIYSIQQIANILKTNCTVITNSSIQYLITDSRRTTFPQSSLFIALVTARRDGHSFIPELYERGVRNFLVKNNFDTSHYPEANFIFANDTLITLQQIAAQHRFQFHYPVIGITGSNGKTIVKEWLYQLLSPAYNIVRNPRSYNSQVGVPLSVWLMDEENNLAIFEAGISMVGEMNKLSKIIQPTLGVLTNIGAAHSENFLNNLYKANEKLNLFKKADALICNTDNPTLNIALEHFKGKIFSWSLVTEADVKIEDIIHENNTTKFTVATKEKIFYVTIPFTDAASLWNACTCITVLLYMGIDAETIAQRMLQLVPVQMRMQLQPAINGCSVINDSYNFDTASFAVALDFLVNQNQFENKTVIISDIPSSKNEKEYEEVVSMLYAKKISKIITIGAGWKKYNHLLNNKIVALQSFNNTSSFIENFSSNHFKNEVILLKGARVFEFEKIASLLQKKVHQTVMEINLTAIVQNLNVYRSKLAEGVKIMAMVKASGYGSGSAEVANLLQFHKVDYLAVAYTDEGVELRKSAINLPIMVMNADEESFETLVENNLEPELFSLNIFKSFTSFLDKQGLNNYPVHIKLDTGMHRLGFEEADLQQLSALLKNNKQVYIKSVFSHLASSDDMGDDDFTLQQADKFLNGCAIIEKAVGYIFIKHISNSAAIFRLPKLQFNMVRLGIGLYGVDSSKQNQQLLQTAVTLKTTIAQIRTLKTGDTVGYNRCGKIVNEAVIATLRIGYADGFKRNLSNGVGKVFIKGKFAPVVGTVAMDMIMVDVTDIENINEADEVEIFGSNLPVQQFAKWCHTIPYEIFTGISQRVKRVYMEEG